MYPKSTAKLKLSDFCWTPREDGSFLPFVFIQKMKRARSYFHGAIFKHVNQVP